MLERSDCSEEEFLLLKGQALVPPVAGRDGALHLVGERRVPRLRLSSCALPTPAAVAAAGPAGSAAAAHSAAAALRAPILQRDLR